MVSYEDILCSVCIVCGLVLGYMFISDVDFSAVYSLSCVWFGTKTCVWQQHSLQLNLPDGVSMGIVVSAVVNAGHVFVQQPAHPTFPALERLGQFMFTCYSDLSAPTLPRPVEGKSRWGGWGDVGGWGE
jgi:hypothetical protein